LFPLFLSHHHHNTCSHTSDRQPACKPQNLVGWPPPLPPPFVFSETASSSCHNSRNYDLIFFFIFLTMTTMDGRMDEQPPYPQGGRRRPNNTNLKYYMSRLDYIYFILFFWVQKFVKLQ
jgi:hypothetical protein